MVPVHVVQLVVTEQTEANGARVVSVLRIVDMEGRLWERFSGDPPGIWYEIQRPLAATNAHPPRPRKQTGNS